MTRIIITVIEDRIFVNTGKHGYVFDATDETWREEYTKLLKVINTIEEVCEPE